MVKYNLKTNETDMNNLISYSFNEGYSRDDVKPESAAEVAAKQFNMLVESKLISETESDFMVVDSIELARETFIKHWMEGNIAKGQIKNTVAATRLAVRRKENE